MLVLRKGDGKEKKVLCLKPLIRVNEGNLLYEDLKKSFISYKHFPYKKQLQSFKKNGWVDIFPCSQCIPCLNMRRYAWVKKMEIEKKSWQYVYFVTITYADNPINLVKRDIQNFIKYYRKFDNDFKYFLCGEYGSKNHRPHYHVILFTNNLLDLEYLKNTKSGVLYRSRLLEKCWLHKGHIFVAFDIDCASFSYVCAYSNKAYSKHALNCSIKSFKKNMIDYWNKCYTNYVAQNESIDLANLYKETKKWLTLIQYYKSQFVPEFVLMSKKPPIGSSCSNYSVAPSVLLKWIKKHGMVEQDDLNLLEIELKKRKEGFDSFLANNDIFSIVESNRLLSFKNNDKNKGIL